MKKISILLFSIFTACSLNLYAQNFTSPLDTGWICGANSFEVMTFNVRYDEAVFNSGKPKKTDWVHRKELQVELIKTYHPDVIGLQEPFLHQIKYFDNQLTSYSWIGVAREDGHEEGEFNPIFYRSDKLLLINSGTFWLSETPDKISRSWDAGYTRICTWALFEDKKSEQKFHVFNTHFDSNGKEARVQSARLLNAKIKQMVGDKPVFVMGDFNFTPESTPYVELTSYGLSDSRAISEKLTESTGGTSNGFRYGATHLKRIDYIFVNNKVYVERYKVITDSKEKIYPSDHFPVLIKATINE